MNLVVMASGLQYFLDGRPIFPENMVLEEELGGEFPMMYASDVNSRRLQFLAGWISKSRDCPLAVVRSLQRGICCHLGVD